MSSEVGDGQGGLACCSPWDRKESDRTKKLNKVEIKYQQDQVSFGGPGEECAPKLILLAGSAFVLKSSCDYTVPTQIIQDNSLS